MNRKKSFAHLLITYTAILLAPVIVIGLLMIFLYLGRLEKNFEELNTKTIETANVQLDMMMQEALTIDYQISTDGDVNTFLFREFQSVQERVSLLVSIRDKIQKALINRSGVSSVAVYSGANDLFVGDDTLYTSERFFETNFSTSDYSQESLFALLETVKIVPIWLDTGDCLMYCSGMRATSYYGDGLFFAAIKKQELLDIWKEVFGNLEIECAVLYRGQDILLQTDGFRWDIYQTDKATDSWRKNYMIKQCDSQDIGNVEYIYIVDYEHFGGDVAKMVRSLGIVTLLLLAVSVCLARRKAKTIRDMYTEVLEERVNLEDQLNTQVEELNLQMLRNALRGYDSLAPEKQGVYLKNNRVRVLIFRPGGDTEGQATFREYAQSCFASENIELLFLYERDMGYICILGYVFQEKLMKAVTQFWKALSQSSDTGIHMGLSSEIQKLTRLADACEQAATARHYCVLQQSDGGIVHYSEILEQEKEKIYYPAEKEVQLLRNIRMGMREKVEESLGRVYQINFKERRLSGSMIRQLLVKMLNTVYVLLDTVSIENTGEQESLGRMSRDVMLTQNREEAFCILRNVMLSACDKCAEQKEGELRRRIVAYIGENFRDPDLSLEKMAEDFDMSYHHMSRLFNECMQMSFSVYLAGLRLEYSTELLGATNISVEQVAQQAGFLQSGSFIRVFKKYYGITPGTYREERQQNR